jgi:hypothetical protein
MAEVGSVVMAMQWAMPDDEVPEDTKIPHDLSRARAVEMFELWRTSSEERHALCPKVWLKLNAEELCKFEVFDSVGTFIMDEYISTTGKNNGFHLALGTILGYLGLLLNQASDRFKAVGSDSIKMFFTCLDSKANTEAAIWLRKLRNKIVRRCFARAREVGEEMDLSATPLYRDDMNDISRAFVLEGSADVGCSPHPLPYIQTPHPLPHIQTPPSPSMQSAEKDFSLETAWRAAGRSGETAWMHLDSLDWDRFQVPPPHPMLTPRNPS